METYHTLRAANDARSVHWEKNGKFDASFFGCELAGEVGEACNVIKKLERERLGAPGSRDTVTHLAEELADVLIVVDLIASRYGIDLEVAVRQKFNATSAKVGLPVQLA